MPLLGFWLYGLFDLDEGFYGAVIAEMNRRGEWITPFYNGLPWFEKPILLYWLAKPSVLLFGNAVGPRLPSVLATVGLLLLCGLFIRKRVSSVAGKWSVAMLGTCLIVIAMGRMMTTDAVLDLCICSAFLSFYESLVGGRAWRLVTALSLGLAVLAKGPVSLPLFIALAVWTYASEKELRSAFRGWWLLGVLILGATVAAWYWPAYLANGQVFVQKFFIEQNVQRFTGGDEAHRVPWLVAPLYYPAILFAGMIPWSVWIVKPWVEDLKGRGTALERYLARWALIILVFFTLSGAKLPHYILPAAPAFAMLGACAIARRQKINWTLLASLSVGYCLLANFAFLYWYHRGGFAEVQGDAREINQMVDGGTGSVLCYQLARLGNAGGLKLNQTDSPSLAFYLDEPRVGLEQVSSFASLEEELSSIARSKPLQSAKNEAVRHFVLTRPDRLSKDEIDELLKTDGVTLEPLADAVRQPQYSLYQVSVGR